MGHQRTKVNSQLLQEHKLNADSGKGGMFRHQYQSLLDKDEARSYTFTTQDSKTVRKKKTMLFICYKN